MTPPTFSIVTTCKGRLEFLKRSLPTFVRQPETEVVVVDYGCPNGTKDWVAAHFPSVRIGSVTGEPFFNLSHARNVGAKLATAPWLVFCDADNLLADSFASEVSSRLAPNTYLRTLKNAPSGPRAAAYPLICETAVHGALGGHDDAFRGWGMEDLDFLHRLRERGAREVLVPSGFVENLPHSEAERSTYYEHSMEVSAVTNAYYARIKQRHFETVGLWLNDEQRHATYGQIEGAVLAALGQPESDAIFEIGVVPSASPWTVRLTAPDIRIFHKKRIEQLAIRPAALQKG